MRPLVRTAVFVGVVAAVGAAVWYETRPSAVEVGVRRVTRGVVEATVANTRAGTIKAHRRAGLAPAIPGTVVELPVREGDVVDAGQLLLRLWSKDIAAELALANAEARQARSARDEAGTRAAHAERDAERLDSLQRDGIAAPEEADGARSLADELRAACKAAEAAIEVATARAATVEAKLAQTELRTPFAGVVAEVNAELGEYVTPSPVGIPTPPAIDLIDRTSLYVL
ncbi:MAG: biotin/lipoyl-binding protein, partial [Planctomycetes bacterium]|nr:biotin/lipoyl-binding protein [Planctomycetota bacterium]